MAKSDEKTLRQLSLLSLLLDARRPVSAHEVRESVEGYACLTDQAFKKRFFDDREDLKAIGLVVQRMRDPRLGESEAYYISGGDYRLPDVHLTADEYTALVWALLLLEERFPYETPLRLALAALGEAQGHAFPVGRPPFAGRILTAGSVEDSPQTRERLQRLEQDLAACKSIRFAYETAHSPDPTTRTVDPYGLFVIDGHWYVVGRDHDRQAVRMFRVDRMRGSISHLTRRPRDFTVPADWDPEQYRARPPWLLGETKGTARIAVDPCLAWWVSQTYVQHVASEDESTSEHVFSVPFTDPDPLLAWVVTWRRHVRLLGPPDLIARLRAGIEAAVHKHEGRQP